MSTVTTTGIRALAAAVRDGDLTPEQRECLVTLLHTLGTATTLARRAQQHYPDNDSAALGYLTGTWEPVERAYAELAGAVASGGEEHTVRQLG